MLRRAAAILTVSAIGIYVVGSLGVIMYPTPGLYGSNSFDGLIELRQRFPDRRVVFLTSRDGYRTALVPKGVFDDAYHVMDQLTVESDFSEAAVSRACHGQSIVCAELAFDGEPFKRVLQDHALGLVPFPILNSTSLSCYQCGVQ